MHLSHIEKLSYFKTGNDDAAPGLKPEAAAEAEYPSLHLVQGFV